MRPIIVQKVLNVIKFDIKCSKKAELINISTKVTFRKILNLLYV